MNKYFRALLASTHQEWKQHLTWSDVTFPILSALGPSIGAGYIAGRSDNELAVSYVFIGAALMTLWALGVFTTGWSLAVEHANGTLDILISTSTPLILIILGKAIAIMIWLLPSAIISFLIVLAFSQRLTPVASSLQLLISGLLAVISVVSFSFIFAPIGFLIGARGGFFNALNPLGTVLGGFLHPIGLLPTWMEGVARLLPTAWAMDAIVRSINGDTQGWQIYVDWALAVALSCVLLALTLWLFQVAEKRVRVTGELGRM